MANAVASEIRIKLTPATVNSLPPRVVSQKAHDAYLRGRYLWNTRSKQGLEQSISFYQEAIKRISICLLTWELRFLHPPGKQWPDARQQGESNANGGNESLTTDPNSDAHAGLRTETDWN